MASIYTDVYGTPYITHPASKLNRKPPAFFVEQFQTGAMFHESEKGKEGCVFFSVVSLMFLPCVV
jgi:hypothetical protein